MRKKDINEIIDGDDNLIGNSGTPPTGSNKETEANGTTDQNAVMHGQNFKNDFLGRFGFWYYESEEEVSSLKEKIAKMMYGKYLQTLDYYNQYPDKLKSDHEKHLSGEEIDFEGNMNSVDHEWADEIMKLIKPFIKDQIDENADLKEDLVEPKDKENLKKEKDDDRELNAKAKRVADLIDKLPEKDREKIKKILEH